MIMNNINENLVGMDDDNEDNLQFRCRKLSRLPHFCGFVDFYVKFVL